MPTLVLELSPDIYQKLEEKAIHLGKSPEEVAQAWITTKAILPLASTNPPDLPAEEVDRKTYQILLEAGILIELGLEALSQRELSVAGLEEVKIALDEENRTPFSDVDVD